MELQGKKNFEFYFLKIVIYEILINYVKKKHFCSKTKILIIFHTVFVSFFFFQKNLIEKKTICLFRKFPTRVIFLILTSTSPSVALKVSSRIPISMTITSQVKNVSLPKVSTLASLVNASATRVATCIPCTAASSVNAALPMKSST